MKKIITILGSLMVAATIYAVDVKIGWDFNPPEELVEKYLK